MDGGGGDMDGKWCDGYEMGLGWRIWIWCGYMAYNFLEGDGGGAGVGTKGGVSL